MINKIDEAITSTIEQVNLQLKFENQIQDNDEQLLMKKGSNVSSLGIAIFIATLENQIKQHLGVKVDLIESLTSDENTAFLEDIGSLKNYLSNKV